MTNLLLERRIARIATQGRIDFPPDRKILTTAFPVPFGKICSAVPLLRRGRGRGRGLEFQQHTLNKLQVVEIKAKKEKTKRDVKSDSVSCFSFWFRFDSCLSFRFHEEKEKIKKIKNIYYILLHKNVYAHSAFGDTLLQKIRFNNWEWNAAEIKAIIPVAIDLIRLLDINGQWRNDEKKVKQGGGAL